MKNGGQSSNLDSQEIVSWRDLESQHVGRNSTQPFLSHNAARWAQAVTADSMSCSATHLSGPCALCSPQNRFGVGRPSSLRREPSVPLGHDMMIAFESRHHEGKLKVNWVGAHYLQ